jgi:hypothetical protein
MVSQISSSSIPFHQNQTEISKIYQTNLEHILTFPIKQKDHFLNLNKLMSILENKPLKT